MNYTGCDAHLRKSRLQHMDEDGALGLSMEVPTSVEGFSAFFDQLDGPTVVTFEASLGYWWLNEFFTNHPKVSQVNVVDPLRSRKIAKELSVLRGYGRAKNDRIDSEMLAEQTRRGLAPTIHVPTAKQLEMRTLNRHRMLLVQTRTRSANRIHAILRMHGVSISIDDLINRSNCEKQRLDKLPGYVKFIVGSFSNQLQLVTEQIQQCERKLDKVLPLSHPQIKLLMTTPGIGPIWSRTILTEILEIDFFKAPKSLICYAGLAPIVHESAGKKGTVKLNPHCNYYLKYAFIEAGHLAMKAS